MADAARFAYAAAMSDESRPIDVMRVRRQQPTRLEGFVDSSFAFALTLVVISIGHAPSSVPEMLQILRGLPTFAACFFLISRFWLNHRFWSRHYDLEDRTSVILSLLLVFLVLCYVYPLRLLFTVAFSSFSNNWLVDAPISIHNIDEVRWAYIVFGVGFVAIGLCFASLYRHALRRADTIGLSSDERQFTFMRIIGWLTTCAVSALSVLTACLLPFDVDKPLLFAVPGLMYALLSFMRPSINRLLWERRSS
jgi:uncharacterized membrane protein